MMCSCIVDRWKKGKLLRSRAADNRTGFASLHLNIIREYSATFSELDPEDRFPPLPVEFILIVQCKTAQLQGVDWLLSFCEIPVVYTNLIR